MSYDIDLASAAKTVQTANEQNKDYVTLSTEFSTAVQGAAQGAQSGLVGKALEKYLTDGFNADLKGIADLTSSAVSNTNNALTAYQQGNDQMMQQSVSALKHSEPQHGFGRQQTAV